MDSEHRFSVCWIFCICKVFNNTNERDISLLGVVPHHKQANYQPHSGSILSSLVTDTKSRLSKNLCRLSLSIFKNVPEQYSPVLSLSHTAMRPQQPASNTGCLLFCLPSQLFKNSISYLRKNHLLYRLPFSASFVSFEFATTKDQWTYNVQRLCPWTASRIGGGRGVKKAVYQLSGNFLNSLHVLRSALLWKMIRPITNRRCQWIHHCHWSDFHVNYSVFDTTTTRLRSIQQGSSFSLFRVRRTAKSSGFEA